MRRAFRALVLALGILGGATVLWAQTLTDANVAAAIKAGEARKFSHLVSDCIATVSFGDLMTAGIEGGVKRTGSYHVILSTNAGRIAFMAANAKRLYKQFSVDDAEEDLRVPGVFVSVEPEAPSRSDDTIVVAAPIEHLVLKSKTDGEAVVQPTTFDTQPVEWTNLLGGKIEGSRAVARFDQAAVRELPAGEFDIVVITPVGERRCKVGTKDRLRLFPAR